MDKYTSDEIVYLGPDERVDIDSFSFKKENLSLEEFVDKFKEIPSIGFDAYQSLYAALRMFGKSESPKEWQDDRWNWLDYKVDGTDRESGGAVYGQEDAAEKLMTYLKNACEDNDEKSRFLLLYGPPSSAKTNFIKLIADTLLAYRTFPQGTRYTVEYDLEDFGHIFGDYKKMKCPANDMPLKFIDKKNLEGLLNDVNKDRPAWQEISVKSPICAHCKKVNSLLRDAGVDEKELSKRIRVINLNPVEDMTIFEFRPTDEKAYDAAEIFGGKTNHDRLGVFVNKNNPLTIEFGMAGNIDGPCAQGGIANFSEMYKGGEQLLNEILDLIQNRSLVINKVYKVSIDMVIMGTSNIEEFEKMKGLPTLGNYLLSRARIIPVGYPLVIDDYAMALNKRIFNKRREIGDIHVQPYFVEILLSTLGVLATLEETKSDAKLTLQQKAAIYNGEISQGVEYSLIEILNELKREAHSKPSSQLREGMDGLPFRFFQNLPSILELNLNKLNKEIFEKLRDQNYPKGCYSMLTLSSILQDTINTLDGITDDCRKRCSNELDKVVGLYEKRLSRDVQMALLGEEKMLTLAVKYLAMSHASVRNIKKVTIDTKEQNIDDSFLNSIEKLGDIKNPKVFRESIAANITHRLGDFKSDIKLLAKDLIEKNSQFRDVISDYTAHFILPNLVDDVALAYSDSNIKLIDTLLKKDYCKSCAGVAIAAASKNRAGKK